jgi:hypothetical protein
MPSDSDPPSDPQHVTVSRRDSPGIPSAPPAQDSAASLGCLGSLSIWTFAWLAVAWLAISRAWQYPALSALVGAVVSGMVAFIGCRFVLRLLHANSAWTIINISSRVSTPRRASGWIAALLGAGVAVIWNYGIFALLIKSAKAGFGWTILFLLFFALIGLFLLFVLLTGIGVAIDSLRRPK